jgi:predicted RNA-binding Zn-ribbon protein involved in translation (DUF1610 family)
MRFVKYNTTGDTMALRELLAKDITDAHTMQWKEERTGSVDRVTAKGMVYAAGQREAMMEALGCVLWGYKLPWQNARKGLRDEFSELRKDRAERDRTEAILRLTCLLRETPKLKDFKGPRTAGVMLVNTTGWHYLAVAAIEEWVDELCRHCHGAGQIKDPISEAVLFTCPTCGGGRKHRYSDFERTPAFSKWKLGLEDYKTTLSEWNNAMTVAHDMIGTADRAMAERMGRWLK